MGRWWSGATITIAFVAGACSSPVDPAPSATSDAPTPSVSPPATTPSTPTASAETDASLAAERVLIRLGTRRGSFLVRGEYPWSPSRCVGTGPARFDGRYPGPLSVRAADDGTLVLAVTLPFERYLEGIAEVPPTWPAAALEAQVIAARSYVLSRTGWTGEEGADLDTPICGTSDCQVYGGIPDPRPEGIGRWYRAVRATKGQVLLFDGRPADTVYSSTSNGGTYGNEDVFGSAPLPYLRPVVERHDGASPLSRWRVELPERDLTTVLRAAGSWPRGAPISSVTVAGSTVQVAGGGTTRTLGADTLRDAVNDWAPCLLPARYPSGGLPVTIPSGWFDLSAGRRGLVVDGRGWGHGVGMVQWGAYGKAARGWSASRILAFYYGGLTPQPYPEPGTMQVVLATGLRAVIVDPPRSGATIGGRSYGSKPIRIVGGEALTVTTRP